MTGAILSRLLLITVCFDHGQGFPWSTPPQQITNSELREKCGLYGSCDRNSQFCDPVLAMCEDCRKLCSTENALCSNKCQAYLQRKEAHPSASPASSRDILKDLDAKWMAFKNETFAFRCIVIVVLLVLLTGQIATVALVCSRRWLSPHNKPSALCRQLPLPSTDHCSTPNCCPETGSLLPMLSSQGNGEPGPIHPNEALNGTPLNYSPINDRPHRHADRCVGLIGLTCGCSQGDTSHSLMQDTDTVSRRLNI